MFKVCLVGRSNVGKTTIFNALVGKRIGLENDSYNTTRDVNQIEINLASKYKFILSDTGGNTDITNETSKHIHDSIKQTIVNTDLILFVVDARVEPTYYELELVKLVRKAKKSICLIFNKTEGERKLFINSYKYFFDSKQLFISAIHRQGISKIKNLILEEMKKNINFSNFKQNNNDEKIIKVALIGQTNVGKSSLINWFSKKEEKNLVLKSPHTTRDAISKTIFAKKRKIEIIDTAGMFKKSKKLDIVDWLALIKTEQKLHDVDTIVFVFDSSKQCTHFDKKVLGKIIDAKLPFLICFNKSDLINNKEEVLFNFKKELTFFQNFKYIFTSALTGKNVPKLIDLIIEVYEKSMIMFNETTLRFLVNSFNFRAQFHMKHNRTRLLSLLQNQKKGNHFTAYFVNTKGIHFSIKRQLVNHIKESLKMEGIPIKLVIRMKKK